MPLSIDLALSFLKATRTRAYINHNRALALTYLFMRHFFFAISIKQKFYDFLYLIYLVKIVN